MCQVCCDNLIYIFTDGSTQFFGNQFKLSTQEGLGAMKDSVSVKTVERCKLGCQKAYPLIMPKPSFKIPRDPLLGLSQARPGLSCADIKEWGA